jgi:hypothetical protein
MKSPCERGYRCPAKWSGPDNIGDRPDFQLHQEPGVHSCLAPSSWQAARRDDAAMKSARVTGGRCDAIDAHRMLGEVGGFARRRLESELLSLD